MFAVIGSRRKAELFPAPAGAVGGPADRNKNKRKGRKKGEGKVSGCAPASILSSDRKQVATSGSKTRGSKTHSALVRRLRAHAGDKPFVCCYEGCGYAFAQSGNLNRHRRIHSGERPFVCPRSDCGSTFARSCHLTRHLCGHNQENCFVCSWDGCQYASTQRLNLTRHWRVHSGEKRRICSYEGCGRAFRESIDLKRHLRVHSGEKPYVCPHEGCGRAFARSWVRKGHLRTHARKESFVCPRSGCGQAFASTCQRERHLRSHTMEKSGVCWRRGSTSLSEQASASLLAAMIWPGVQADLNPEPESLCVSSGSLAPTTTAAGTGHWLPSHRSQGVPCGWGQPASAQGTRMADWADWLAGYADEYLSGPVPLSYSTVASDPGVHAWAGADDDSTFWQALISPEFPEDCDGR